MRSGHGMEVSLLEAVRDVWLVVPEMRRIRSVRFYYIAFGDIAALF